MSYPSGMVDEHPQEASVRRVHFLDGLMATDNYCVDTDPISGSILDVAESLMRCCREVVNCHPCNRRVASALLQMA